jgi:hypothetical protein
LFQMCFSSCFQVFHLYVARLYTYVASICFKCFKCFIWRCICCNSYKHMFQVYFHMFHLF